MVDVAIFGAGGLGCLVHDILLQSPRFRPVAFLDSDAALHGCRMGNLPIVGDIAHIDELRRMGVGAVIVAIGINAIRVRLAEELRALGMKLVSAIHPLASASPSAQVGEHAIIGARATVCVHARVAAHCVISTGSIVEHDNVLEAGAFLHPAVRLAGGVHVESLAVLGIGSSVIPGRRIGRGASVAPGAVVIHDVPAGQTVSGIPARAPNSTARKIAAKVA